MLDTQHFPTPMTAFNAEITPPTIGKTMSEVSASRGGLQARAGRAVNGFMYFQGTYFGNDPGVNEAPAPDDQEMHRRLALAVESYRSKYWRAEGKRWFEDVKPDSIRINLALAMVDVTQLSRSEIFDHVAICRNNMFEGSVRHHTFNTVATFPTALLIHDVTEWTDLPAEDVISLLDGASPISAGITPELVELADAIRDDPDSRSLVDSDMPTGDILAALLAAPGKVGEVAQRFWYMDGHRLATGFDLWAKNAFELPEMLLENIRNTVNSGPPDQTGEAEALARFVRNKIPSEHHEAFDEELTDARANIRIKDERGLYNDVWANGITRKALLEAGGRLVGEERLHDREHFMEADWVEMQEIWKEGDGTSADELAERRETRLSLTWRDAPPFLGPPPSPPPPVEGLPPEVMRMDAAQAALGNIIGRQQAQQDGEDLVGVTASKGQYEGTARVAVGDYSFDRIKSGDVLVTSTHSEAFNAVVQRLGAIVADTGGPLSHLSIVSREIGIPCVVTCKNATTLIKDGDRIRVDGESGRVTIL